MILCTWTSHQFLQMIKQSESFLVGHRGEGFIRVHIMQIRDQVCEHIIRSKLFDLQNDTEVTCFASKLHQEITKQTEKQLTAAQCIAWFIRISCED